MSGAHISLLNAYNTIANLRPTTPFRIEFVGKRRPLTFFPLLVTGLVDQAASSHFSGQPTTTGHQSRRQDRTQPTCANLGL